MFYLCTSLSVFASHSTLFVLLFTPFNHSCHPSTSFTIIVKIFRNISGTRATVRIDLTRFMSCDFIVGGSPNPWTFCQGAQPTLARNLSSFNTQTAFKHNKVASKRDHKVNAILFVGTLTNIYRDT